METILIIAVVGTLNAVCFFIGAKVGQTVTKGETIEAPNLNPVEMVREHKDKREQRKVQDRLEILLENVDSYDGTGIGQKDIPR
jgi:hypothetical protein